MIQVHVGRFFQDLFICYKFVLAGLTFLKPLSVLNLFYAEISIWKKVLQPIYAAPRLGFHIHKEFRYHRIIKEEVAQTFRPAMLCVIPALPVHAMVNSSGQSKAHSVGEQVYISYHAQLHFELWLRVVQVRLLPNT